LRPSDARARAGVAIDDHAGAPSSPRGVLPAATVGRGWRLAAIFRIARFCAAPIASVGRCHCRWLAVARQILGQMRAWGDSAPRGGVQQVSTTSQPGIARGNVVIEKSAIL